MRVGQVVLNVVKVAVKGVKRLVLTVAKPGSVPVFQPRVPTSLSSSRQAVIANCGKAMREHIPI